MYATDDWPHPGLHPGQRFFSQLLALLDLFFYRIRTADADADERIVVQNVERSPEAGPCPVGRVAQPIYFLRWRSFFLLFSVFTGFLFQAFALFFVAFFFFGFALEATKVSCQ